MSRSKMRLEQQTQQPQQKQQQRRVHWHTDKNETAVQPHSPKSPMPDAVSKSSLFFQKKSIWLMDDKLLKSKLFCKRLNTASTRIQKIYRGWIIRRTFAVVKASYLLLKQQSKAAQTIQCTWRHYRRVTLRTRLTAVVRMQAWIRRVRQQRHYNNVRQQHRLKTLKGQFKRSQQAKEEELDLILKWKKAQKKAIKRELYKEAEEQEQRKQALLELLQKEEQEVKEQNKVLIKQQEELEQSLTQAKVESKALKKQAKEFQKQTLSKKKNPTKSLKKLHAERKEWEAALQMYETRIQEYQYAIEECEWAGMVEHSILKNYETSMKQIKWKLELTLNKESSSNHDSESDSDSDSEDESEDNSDSEEDEYSDDEESVISSLEESENSNSDDDDELAKDGDDDESDAKTEANTESEHGEVDETVLETYNELKKIGVFNIIKEHVKRPTAQDSKNNKKKNGSSLSELMVEWNNSSFSSFTQNN